MADGTDYTQLAQIAAAMYGQAAASQMTQQQLDLLGQQLARVNAVPIPNQPTITPDQLGPSAMGAMAPDQATRGKQLQALAEVQNIIDHGGTDLTEQASLEQAMNQANTQQQRARETVAANAAARGQMNSGTRMAMDLDAASQGANAARSSGLQAAAQAQQRRLAAIQDAASMESSLRNQDWSEQAQAANAKDLRDQYNAAAREKAQYYNAGLPQQTFQNQMSKANAGNAPTNAMGNALQGAGTGARQDAAGLIGVLGAAGKGKNGQTGQPTDPGLDYSGQQDYSGSRGGAGDLSGGAGGGAGISDSTLTPPPNAPTEETDWSGGGFT